MFPAYAWFALVLVLAAFFSIAASIFVSMPSAAVVTVFYMPLALLFGILVYRIGLRAEIATIVALVLEVLSLYSRLLHEARPPI